MLLPAGGQGRTLPGGVVQDGRHRRGAILHGRAVEGRLLLVAGPLPHRRRARARQRLRVMVVVMVVVVRRWRLLLLRAGL